MALPIIGGGIVETRDVAEEGLHSAAGVGGARGVARSSQV